MRTPSQTKKTHENDGVHLHRILRRAEEDMSRPTKDKAELVAHLKAALAIVLTGDRKTKSNGGAHAR